MALNLKSPSLTEFCEDDSMVLLVFHKRWPVAGEFLEHSGNRSRSHL